MADDEELIARARNGDLEAYGALIARFTAPAHRLAVLLGAGADADDVVQEAFVKAHGSLNRFRPGAPFRPWLLRIVANEAKNTVRSRGRRESLALRVPEQRVAPDDPEAEIIAAERRKTLLTEIEKLPERERQVLLCRYFLDLSEAETAEILACPRGSVKSRTSRGLTRLRNALGEEAHRG
ncbi:RNA polymerase sigma factor RpoE [Actinocorallia longicatena]|uniref:RNA polymerase sigma factor RpoE n=1 Tax=Actinocorallia longicatena TaxID=111803 RepID=A0ABP6Q997_9ACTN